MCILQNGMESGFPFLTTLISPISQHYEITKNINKIGLMAYLFTGSQFNPCLLHNSIQQFKILLKTNFTLWLHSGWIPSASFDGKAWIFGTVSANSSQMVPNTDCIAYQHGRLDKWQYVSIYYMYRVEGIPKNIHS